MCTTNGLKFTHHFRLWTVLLNVFVKLQKTKELQFGTYWIWCVQYKQNIKVEKLKAKIRG